MSQYDTGGGHAGDQWHLAFDRHPAVPGAARAFCADTSSPRALVPVLPIAPSEFNRTVQHYPAANFLAHLIAVRQRSPQTRRRARAAPGDAAAAYAAARAEPVRLGQALKKSA